jgi:hypothetical protein
VSTSARKPRNTPFNHYFLSGADVAYAGVGQNSFQGELVTLGEEGRERDRWRGTPGERSDKEIVEGRGGLRGLVETGRGHSPSGERK